VALYFLSVRWHGNSPSGEYRKPLFTRAHPPASPRILPISLLEPHLPASGW
jgi:hypothetical protein